MAISLENEDIFENSGLDEAEAYDVLGDTMAAFWKRPDELYKVITKASGNTFRFRCVAGGSPEPNVTWSKNNDSITADSRVRFCRWFMQIDDVEQADAGSYTCLACNLLGCISHSTKLEIQERFSRTLDLKSFPASLKAENLQAAEDTNGLEENETYGVERDEPTPPYWRKESDLNKIVGKPSGNTFEFKCPAGGFPMPNITWFKNGMDMQTDKFQRVMGKVKYKKWAINLEDIIPSDSGNYTCRACNSQGCIDFTTKLVVEGKRNFFFFVNLIFQKLIKQTDSPPSQESKRASRKT